MATKKTTEQIPVNDIFGNEIEDLKEAVEELDQQYQMQRQMIVAQIQTAVRLAGRSENIPDGYQFDVDAMAFVPAKEEQNGAE